MINSPPSIIRRSAVGVKVLLPVACIEPCVLDWVAAVQKHGVAHIVQPHIEADVGDARGVISPNEKHQVARLRIGYPCRNVVKPLRSQPPGIA